MIPEYFKFYFLYLCNIYICIRLFNYPDILKRHKVIVFIYPFTLALLSYILNTHFTNLSYIIPIFLIWISISIITTQPKTSFLLTVISFILSYCISVVSSCITLLILSPIYYKKTAFSFTVYVFATAIVQLLISLNIFNIKRFNRGMPFLLSKNNNNIATLICIFFITLLGFFPGKRIDLWWQDIALYLIIFIFVFLIHWWQTQITKSYKQALINRELESLRMELEEKEKQLAEISTRNEELGRLIHKDNKRIPAMEHAVSEFLVMDLSDKEKAIERTNTLLLEIQKLSEDRNNTITEIYARKYKHHDTGISELDTMLNYMEKRAYGEHIKLSVQTAINFHDFVPNNISAEDLSHILSDLLENAIIASKHNASPVIQLQFYQVGKDFVIEIADNGIPFEADSLVNFGLTQLTTHADTGGSGIGLMDIWKIKEKYGISLHITEYENDAPYTKKIALIFNKKNRYTISTPRKEELSTLCKRTDLQIF